MEFLGVKVRHSKEECDKGGSATAVGTNTNRWDLCVGDPLYTYIAVSGYVVLCCVCLITPSVQ